MSDATARASASHEHCYHGRGRRGGLRRTVIARVRAAAAGGDSAAETAVEGTLCRCCCGSVFWSRNPSPQTI